MGRTRMQTTKTVIRETDGRTRLDLGQFLRSRDRHFVDFKSRR
jgi:hypothetical protein